jgi:hypothetical protein
MLLYPAWSSYCISLSNLKGPSISRFRNRITLKESLWSIEEEGVDLRSLEKKHGEINREEECLLTIIFLEEKSLINVEIKFSH